MNNLQDCKKCELYLNNAIIEGNGPEEADVMFIIDNPNYYDVKNRKILGDEVGNIFNRLLDLIQIPREQVYVTSLVKCRAPGRVKKANVEACKTHLVDEIALIKPKIIVTMGTKAFQTITKIKEPVDKYRNFAIPTTYGWLLPMYNLNYVLSDIRNHSVALKSFIYLYKLNKLKVNPLIENLEDKLEDVIKSRL